MDHKYGTLGLISWQDRPNRRFKTGFPPWTAVTAVCALVGAAGIGAEMAGWIHPAGVLAMVAPALILLAISAQLIAIVRALLTWFAS